MSIVRPYFLPVEEVLRAGIGSAAVLALIRSYQTTRAIILSRPIKHDFGTMYMRAIVKGFHSSDTDLATFYPEDEQDFSFLVEIDVGSADRKGADQFRIEVGSSSGFARFYAQQGSFWGRHKLIVLHHDLANIKSLITRYVEGQRCQMPDVPLLPVLTCAGSSRSSRSPASYAGSMIAG